MTLTTIPKLRARHAKDERALVLAALKEHGWRYGATAKALDLHPTQLGRLIDQHDLREIYTEHSPGRGRPQKSDD